MIRGAKTGQVKPRTFLGIGGIKIFRDEIWGPLRFVFQADHHFYRGHGYYDFPQGDIKASMTNMTMMTMTKMPAMKEGYQKVLVDRMNDPLNKLLEELWRPGPLTRDGCRGEECGHAAMVYTWCLSLNVGWCRQRWLGAA